MFRNWRRVVVVAVLAASVTLLTAGAVVGFGFGDSGTAARICFAACGAALVGKGLVVAWRKELA